MKRLLILSALIFLLLSFLILKFDNEEVKFDKFTTVQIKNNPFNFGTITKNDTVKHIFRITNITKTPFIIEKVAPSCTCTVLKTDKKVCSFNETASIEVYYIPKQKQKGKVKTVVFVQCNAEKGVIKLELIGNIN